MKPSDISVPEAWPESVRSAMLRVVSLAHFAIIWTRSWCANSPIQRVRMAGELDRAKNVISVQAETIRIQQARMSRIPARHRPHYASTEKMAILELKAVMGWSLAETARVFLVEPETIAEWLHRADDESLVQTPEPVNRFPPFVRYLVKRLKVLCPRLGRKKIAQILARAGLHLGATTIQRYLKSKWPPAWKLAKDVEVPSDEATSRVVTARYPGHVWHVDLTTIPIDGGFWSAWLPFSLPQRWPFAYWIGVIVDHFSRRVMGFALFLKEPTSIEIRSFLGRAIRLAGQAPRHLISDHGGQFDCPGYRQWCRRRKIKWRYGAIGKYGSLAVIERFIRSMKSEYLWRILIPMQFVDFRRGLSADVVWFNRHRPHEALGGRTPMEVYEGVRPANRKRRFEPRANYPPKGKCSSPQTAIRGNPGDRIELCVSYLDGKKQLPIVDLKKVTDPEPRRRVA